MSARWRNYDRAVNLYCLRARVRIVVPAHPHQQRCKRLQCIRPRAARGASARAPPDIAAKSYRLKTSRRKHEEYLRRKAGKMRGPPSPHPAEPYHGPAAVRNLNAYFMGLISYATGATDAQELNRLYTRCYEIGRNVNLRL